MYFHVFSSTPCLMTPEGIHPFSLHEEIDAKASLKPSFVACSASGDKSPATDQSGKHKARVFLIWVSPLLTKEIYLVSTRKFMFFLMVDQWHLADRSSSPTQLEGWPEAALPASLGRYKRRRRKERLNCYHSRYPLVMTNIAMENGHRTS